MAKNHKKLNVHRKKTLTWLKNHKKTYLPRKKAFEGGGNITKEICIKMGIYTFNSFQVGNICNTIYAMVQAKIQMCTKNTRND